MSEFRSRWKAYPYELLNPPYSLSHEVVALYAFILDEYEYWSRNDKLNVGYTPSIRHLGAMMGGTSESTIKRQLHRLRDAGLLETRQRMDKTSIFTVHHFEHPNTDTDQATTEHTNPIYDDSDPPY